MSLLIPDSGLLFWMSLVFIIVFAILLKWGFPVITNMVNERKAFIDDSLKKAHEANVKLTNIKLESESLLQEARDKQAAILKDASETRAAMMEKAQTEAKDESARLIEEAKKEIQNQKEMAVREIRSQVAELSVQIAEKILREKLSTDEAQMKMIERLLDEVSVDKEK